MVIVRAVGAVLVALGWIAAAAGANDAALESELVIAKTIVEMHQGRIWVESDKGRGSTFSFSLPAV